MPAPCESGATARNVVVRCAGHQIAQMIGDDESHLLETAFWRSG
jgi:hypothetical protein